MNDWKWALGEVPEHWGWARDTPVKITEQRGVGYPVSLCVDLAACSDSSRYYWYSGDLPVTAVLMVAVKAEDADAARAWHAEHERRRLISQ